MDAKLARSAEAFRTYRRTTFAERAAWMAQAADILEAEKDAFARIMTLEMGKPLEAARQEAAKCAAACRYYVEHAERYLADELVDPDAPMSFIRYQPIGAVLAIMPWNFPFWQVFRFLAPALMAGNVGLLKHASNVPQCALAIEDIVRRAGFPDGVFQTLLIGAEQVHAHHRRPARESRHPHRQRAGGPQVAAQAGKRIKKCVLELGGSDPFIVMPSADLDAAVRTAVQARIINNGQSCIAAKRFIVEESIADEFQAALCGGHGRAGGGRPDAGDHPGGSAGHARHPARARRAGPPLGRGRRSRAHRGAEVERPGNYYAPTVLVDVPENSPAYREELFGPVAVVMRARGIEAAIRLANDTPFGLGASAWTPGCRRAGSASSTKSIPAWCSSTAWWHPTRACPSAASRHRATAANSAPSEFANS